MTQVPFSLPDLFRETVNNPRSAARRVIALNPPANLMAEVLALVVILSVLAGQGVYFLSGGGAADGEILLPEIFSSPFRLVVAQGVLMAIMVIATWRIGQLFGGGGTLSETVALVAWLQFVMVCLQIVQSVIGLFMPGAAVMLGVLGIAAFFYLLTIFICELHGFTRPGMVFAGIMASMMGLIFALSILLGLLGLGLAGEMPNV